MKYHVIIIGGGASGMMAVATAARRGLKACLLEHNEKLGAKVSVSGGGRCNITNLNLGPEHYISKNMHFVKSALARFTPEDVLGFLRRHKIGYVEESDGQVFCKARAKEVVGALNREILQGKADIYNGIKIRAVRMNNGFKVVTDKGEIFSDALVVATGGLSYKKLGATDLGYRIAKQFGLNVGELRPGLVPLKFGVYDRALFSGLAGVSFKAAVSYKKLSFDGGVLITHGGLSGPAILQISSYWEKGQRVNIDLISGSNFQDLLLDKWKNGGKEELKNLLSGVLPKRFALRWCDIYEKSLPINQYSLNTIKKICERLHNWSVQPIDTEGLEVAEVTVGGVDTDGISSQTMEARGVPGLYFIGEVADVTGRLGGYNLHWAWASGFAAGESVGR